MSAFVVFSMMGFYPVVPGVPVYEFSSPVFDKITMSLQNGKTLELIAKDTSKDNKYITGVKLNGKTSDKVWFRHDQITDGLKIDLQMSDTPNKDLGAAPANYPPSSINLDPANF